MSRPSKAISPIYLLAIALITAGLIFGLFPPSGTAADRFVLKYACFAPEGSTYVKNMRAWDAELRERSGGRLSFRIYPGGVQGDERDMLRKVRVGQLHMVGMTGLGLGEVLPAIRILEMPGYYQSYKEVDVATAAAEDTLKSMMRDAGYELLGWGEAGTVHLFSQKKIENLDHLNASRMWAWEGDKISETLFDVFSIKPVPLTLPDVLPSLQSGTIDGVYGSPLAVVALQWSRHVSFMTEQKLGRAMGGTIIDNRRFAKLPADLQALLVETGEKWHNNILREARIDNEKSIETLIRQGVEVVTLSPKSWSQLDKGFAEVRSKLNGEMWPPSLLEIIEKSVSDHRTSQKTTTPNKALKPQDTP